MKPLLAGGLGPGGLRTVYLLGAISAGKALTLVVLAESLATGVVSVIGGTSAWHGAVAWGLLAAFARAALSWGGQVAAARSAVGAKETRCARNWRSGCWRVGVLVSGRPPSSRPRGWTSSTSTTARCCRP